MFQTNGAPSSGSYADSTPPSSVSNGGAFLGVPAAVGSSAHHPVYVPSNRAMMGGLPQHHHHHHPQYSPSTGPTTNSHHFMGGSTSSHGSWHHQTGAPDGYVTATPHHHHHLGAGAPHHQTPLSSPFYAQNAMMMSSWRAYDTTGFQRTSPYGTLALVSLIAKNRNRLCLCFKVTRFLSTVLKDSCSYPPPSPGSRKYVISCILP
jgi:hypothetical protein